MYSVSAATEYQPTALEQAPHSETEVTIKGCIQSVRRLGGLTFLILRGACGFLQVSVERIECSQRLSEGQWLTVLGIRVREPRAPGGVEVRARSIEILACPQQEFPCTLSKKTLELSLETELELRPLSLRHATNYQRFAVQAALVRGFRESLRLQHFHEVFSPKLVASSAEGGAAVFALPYFGQEAYLAQSPQLYKQMLVGIYERVFEVGHVYRAEQHNSARHLNEYVGLDIEIGFVQELAELMRYQASLLHAMFLEVETHCALAVSELGIQIPQLHEVPVLHVNEAKELLHKHAPGIETETGSLSAAEERALGAIMVEQHGAELVFVTHYHAAVRPFYTREVENAETASFDALFRGLEICTGGLRIHEPELLKQKMRRLGMSEEPFRHYLSAFEYGLPPHGGSCIGLERITMLLTGAKNVRQGAFFPRDRSRLVP